MAEDRRPEPQQPLANDADAGRLPAEDFLSGNTGSAGTLPPVDHLAGLKEPGQISTLRNTQPAAYQMQAPQFEEALARTEEFIAERWGRDVADSVVRPMEYADPLPEGVSLNEIFQEAAPILLEDAESWQAAQQFRAEFAESGGNPETLDWSRLRQMAAFMGDSVEGGIGTVTSELAESRSWWKGLKRKLANTTTRVVTHPDFQVGLQTLDFFTYVNKKFKLAFVPSEERAEIEQRVLPKITLSDGSSYKVATGQAIENIWNRAWGANTQLVGWATENLGDMLGSETLKDIGSRSRDRGAAQREVASERINEAASLMGEHLSWITVGEVRDPTMFVGMSRGMVGGVSDEEWDAIEAEVRAQDSIDPLLEKLQTSQAGQELMALWAVGDGLLELVADPSLVAGELVSKAGPAIRGITKMAAPAKHASITAKVARATRLPEDAANAVAAARNRVDRLEKAARKQAQRAGGSISMDQAREIATARRELVNEEVWLSRYKGPGEYDVILPRARRTHPDSPNIDLKTTEKYVENYPSIDRETGQFTVQRVEGEYVRPKTTDELAKELHEIRVKELGRDADMVLPKADQTEGLPLFDELRALGADDVEQAGDALNHVTRTGGVGIDDVWLHGPNPMHRITPDSQFGLIDWRALDAANDVTRAERQFLSTSGARQYELGYSARRSLHRQLDITKRNYGKARAAGNSTSARVYEREMKLVKEAIRKASNDKAIRKADKTFDPKAWLGGETPPPMSNPSTFANRLNVFGDRVLETAYPGGWGIRGLLQSKLGQSFLWLREPQRVFETFSPDTWDRVQSGFTRYHGQNRAWNEGLVHGGQKAGILKKRSKWDPRNQFKPYEVDEAKNELLYDLLNTRRDTDEWAELAAKADDNLLAFHDDLRKQMDHWADVQGIGKGGDSPRYLEGYMRHVVTADQFAGGARPLEYIGVPRNANIFVSHLLPRTGSTQVRKDALAVLDLYGRAANRKLHVEPLFDDVIRTGQELAEKHKNPVMLQYANDMVAELSGKPTPWMARVDQFMGWAHDSLPARLRRGKTWEPGAIDRSLTGLSGLLWAGTLPGNPRYPIMQIATGIATTGSRYGLYRTTRALFQQATREGQAMAKAAGTYDEFLNIFESDQMRKFSKFMAEKGYTFSPFGVMSTGQAEEFIRGMTFHASVDMHMTKLGISSWDEAVETGFAQRIVFEAVRSSQEVNHMFGALGRSPMLTRGAFQSKGLATSTTQFLSFIPKQTEELLSQANRNPGFIARYMALSGAMSRIAAETAGVDLTNYTGFGYMPTQPVEDIRSPLMDTLIESLSWMSAASRYDRMAMRQHQEAVLQGIDNLIPAMVAWETAAKSAERLTSGEDVSATGRLNRRLELGEFGEDPTLQNLFGTMGPEGLRDQGDEFPTVGGDLGPSLFGQQAIRDRLYHRGRAALADTIDKYMFEVQVRVEELQDALEAGEIGEAHEVMDILRTDYNILIDPERALESRVYAQQLGATFRTLNDRAPDPIKAQVYEQIKNFGLKIE